MKYVFLLLGVISSVVSLSVTNRMMSDWNYYLVAGSLRPEFVIGVVWFISFICFMFAFMFTVDEKRA